MMYVGILVIIAVVVLLVKQKDTRTVLIGAGIFMALLSGNPMLALNAFAERMTAGSLIQSICSVMGFATVLKLTKCDKHLVNLVVGGLSKYTALLIPGAALATFFINISLTSAAGTSAAVGSIFIPMMIQAGVAPAMAASAVMLGTFGSMLSPGNSHTVMVADMAKVDVMEVVAVHSTADLVAIAIGVISLVIIAKIRKEDKGYVLEGSNEVQEQGEVEKANVLYALVSLVPIIILVLGNSVLPILKMGVPHAMLIGAMVALVVTRTNPKDITKAFFDGMGNAYANVIGIIIAAGVFVGGMNAIGLVDALIEILINAPSNIVKFAATFGPFILSVIVGSGDAATIAFNEAVTPQAAQFGLEMINMGSLANLAGALGRTMSPLAGAAIICAGLAKVNPMELAKRLAPGMIIAATVAMFILV